MVLATKERITAHRLFATRRYILSTLPVLYISGRRDFQGTNQFLSDDGYGHLATVTGALWTPQGYSFDGDDHIDIAVNSTLQNLNSLSVFTWEKAATPTSSRYLAAHYDTGANKRKWNISSGPAGNRDKLLVFLVSDGLTPGAANSKQYQSSLVAVDENWHLIGFTFAAPSSTLTLYVDGVADTNPTKTLDA